MLQPVIIRVKRFENLLVVSYLNFANAKTVSKNQVFNHLKPSSKKDLSFVSFLVFVTAPANVALNFDGVSLGLISSQRADTHLEAYLTFSFLLYIIGLFGRILNRKNFIVTRRAVEIRYLGVITSFVIYGTVLNDPRGFIYGLLLVILAACESAIGLGIILVLHRFGGTINFKDYEELGG